MSGLAVDLLRLDLKLYFIQSTLESLVYGCYIVTFGMSMYTLSQRRKMNKSGLRWDVCALVLLFLITTVVTITDLIANASILYNTFGLGGLRAGLSKAQIHRFDISMQMVAEMGFVLANFLTDFVLMFRCYIIWDSKLRIVIFPMILSFMNNLLGFSAVVILLNVFVGDVDPVSERTLRNFNAANRMLVAFFFINVIPNLLITGMIAGRIWWIMKKLERINPDVEAIAQIRKRYRSTVILILESGLVYPATLIVFVIVLRTAPLAPSLYPLVSTIAGMAPTLIIVRVQLGVSIKSLDEYENQTRLTTLNFNRSPRSCSTQPSEDEQMIQDISN
ncbi:hypothetical protein D9758_016906 [Tetrapyrgos nigripes]|uniref:Uncharacterized protein n=1 Tax=Tetrapyrgos nigripes TaxID=182062 RepID=A0A8H5C5F7_9AGAR|nr:hypothetical protein D9758_016906 [Tetrapyrgos nigripes]